MLTRPTSVLFLSITATVVLAVTNISLGAKGGKDKPGSDPPVLPDVRYTIDRIPLPEGYTGLFINKINNSGMVVGWFYFQGEERTGFLYDQRTKHTHDLDNLTHLMSLPSDWWTVWKLSSAVGINDLGDVVGYVTDATGFRKGYMLETGLSQNPADWTLQFLPELGSDFSYGRGINLHGDVLGLYTRPDGTRDAYLYNPWVDGPAGTPPLPLGVDVRTEQATLNNHRQVAGHLTDGRAFFFDPDRPDGLLPLQVIDDADIRRVEDLNDNGVFCGIGRVRINGRRTRTVAFRYTDHLEPIIGDWARGINSDNDVVVSDSETELVSLVHTGFEPDYEEQVWNISDLIWDDDPLRTFWVDNGHSIAMRGLADRDETTGFSQMVGKVREPQPDGSTRMVGVVLTPR